MSDNFIAQERVNVAEIYMPNTDTWVVELEVEVFKVNKVARKFYAKYGFKPIEEKLHEPTGQGVLRLKFSGVNTQ